MIDRVIDISNEPAFLKTKHGCLVICRNSGEENPIPYKEIAAIVTSNPRITYTHSVLSSLAEAGAMLVVCGKNHMPQSMQMPLQGNFVQAERFSRQAEMKLPVKKRLWQEIIKNKISAQSRLLLSIHGDDQGLGVLTQKIGSGDPSNVEARASRKYWSLLFQDPDFRRRRDADDQNRLLNYGYSVLLALVCRAVCAAGLHPSIGIHHHNKYNPFCLGSDLMEPFRPLVDKQVHGIVTLKGPDAPLDSDVKRCLIKGLTGRFRRGEETRNLFDICHKIASRLVAVIEGRKATLGFMEISYE